MTIPFQSHSQTSFDAAVSIGVHVGTLRDRAYVIFKMYHFRGLTDEELVTIMRLPANTVRPRRVELARQGVIVPIGKRKTLSGRDAVVWCVRTERNK